jgi:hypothetical protein
MSSALATSRFRFDVKTMLVIVALLALGLTFAPRIYEWYWSVPLADAVDELNSRYDWLYTEKGEPVLTEQEVISAIQSKLPTLFSRELKEIFSRIVRTHRLPHNASLKVSTFGNKNTRIATPLAHRPMHISIGGAPRGGHVHLIDSHEVSSRRRSTGHANTTQGGMTAQ